MMRALGRLILVPLATIVALATSALVIVTLGLERMTVAIHAPERHINWWVALFDAVEKMSALARVTSIAPPLLLIIVGEVARIRSATYYIVGGGAVVAVMPLLAKATVGNDLFDASAIWQVCATAGFAGGLAYWIIAGRQA